jgi:hypothetical protein
MVLKLVIAATALVMMLLAVTKVPLRYNARNVAVRWKTTAMTALAFTVVIGLLTVMLGFVNGMYQLTLHSGQPGNVIVLSDRATDEVVSNLLPTDVGDLERQPGILRDGDRPMASRETYFVVNQPLRNARAGRPGRRFVQVRGLDDPELSARVHGLEMLPGGQWFSSAGVREAADAGDPRQRELVEAVLGEGVAGELGRDRDPATAASWRRPDRLDVGDTFPLGGRTWVVAGVLNSGGSTFNSEVWAKRSLMGGMFGKDTYTSLVCRTADAESARKLKEFFTTQYRKSSVLAQVETDYYESLSNTNKQFLYAIAFVTAVMAIGGAFGVMNTMFAAISQRIRDIGVLRLLGYRRRQILVSFLLESLIIALVGGLAGCALGYLANGLSATSIVNAGPGGGKSVVLRLIIDARILGVGFLLAIAMGLLGGLIPSLSAMRLKPLESLR